jgi:hypothetical protein
LEQGEQGYRLLTEDRVVEATEVAGGLGVAIPQLLPDAGSMTGVGTGPGGRDHVTDPTPQVVGDRARVNEHEPG